MTYDPRAIANLILAEGNRRGFGISNLKLQKLLFLCHALFLVQKSKPLVHGSFEAWQYGPVSRVAYDAFRTFRERDISSPATRLNPATGEISEFPVINDLEVLDVVSSIVSFYGHWRAGELVDLTHSDGGPWHYVVENSKSAANVGLRISDAVIRERYKYLWFGRKPHSNETEPHEDHPLTRYRSR